MNKKLEKIVEKEDRVTGKEHDGFGGVRTLAGTPLVFFAFPVGETFNSYVFKPTPEAQPVSFDPVKHSYISVDIVELWELTDLPNTHHFSTVTSPVGVVSRPEFINKLSQIPELDLILEHSCIAKLKSNNDDVRFGLSSFQELKPYEVQATSREGIHGMMLPMHSYKTSIKGYGNDPESALDDMIFNLQGQIIILFTEGNLRRLLRIVQFPLCDL